MVARLIGDSPSAYEVRGEYGGFPMVTVTIVTRVGTASVVLDADAARVMASDLTAQAAAAEREKALFLQGNGASDGR